MEVSVSDTLHISILGYRSLRVRVTNDWIKNGTAKILMTEKAIALMQGVQSQGVFSTGKHFPGHGDTATDSHYTLPVVTATKEHLDKVELYPYKRMIDEGLISVMVAHLNVPSLEFRDGHPSSLSYNVITNLLKQEMGFDGLIFTDALNMKGASNFKKPGEIDLEALMAGNDVLLFAENVPVAVEKICMAYQDGLLSEERLAYSVKKILRYKFKAGLNNYKPIDLANLSKDLNAVSKDALQYELYENIVTVLKNEDEIVPIEKLDQKIAYVKMGDDTNTTFVNTLKKYTEVTEVSDTNIDSLKKQLKGYDKVIIGFHKSDRVWKKHDFTETELLWIQEIAKQNKTTTLLLLALLGGVFNPLLAQEATTAAEGATEVVATTAYYGGLSALSFWTLTTVLGLELLIIFVLLYFIRNLWRILNPVPVKLTVDGKKAPSWIKTTWSNLDKKFFTKAAPIEQPWPQGVA